MAAQSPDSAPVGKSNPRPLRIVVVDDDRDTAESIKLILEDEGDIVSTLHNGKDVLALVQSFRPDAVILDVAIPGMSGYAVAQAIRHSFTDALRPMLIAISGMWTEHPDRLIARQVGFDHHLLKPAHTKDLLELLQPIR